MILNVDTLYKSVDRMAVDKPKKVVQKLFLASNVSSLSVFGNSMKNKKIIESLQETLKKMETNMNIQQRYITSELVHIESRISRILLKSVLKNEGQRNSLPAKDHHHEHHHGHHHHNHHHEVKESEIKEVLHLQRLEKEIKKLSAYVNNCKEDIEDTSDNQSEARFDSPHRLSRALEK